MEGSETFKFLVLFYLVNLLDFYRIKARGHLPQRFVRMLGGGSSIYSTYIDF